MYQIDSLENTFYQISSQVYQALNDKGVTISPEKFAYIVKYLHNEVSETGKAPSAEKIINIVNLAVN